MLYLEKKGQNDLAVLDIKWPRGGSGAAATFKVERFVIIVNGFQPLTIITKCSILDVAAVLDPPLVAFDNLLINLREISKYTNRFVI